MFCILVTGPGPGPGPGGRAGGRSAGGGRAGGRNGEDLRLSKSDGCGKRFGPRYQRPSSIYYNIMCKPPTMTIELGLPHGEKKHSHSTQGTTRLKRPSCARRGQNKIGVFIHGTQLCVQCLHTTPLET